MDGETVCTFTMDKRVTQLLTVCGQGVLGKPR